MRAVFVLLVILVTPARSLFFDDLCLSPYLDSALDTGPRQMASQTICNQTFAATIDDALDFCSRKMPYPVEAASKTKDTVSCRWKSNTACGLDDIPLFGDCLTVGSADGSCPSGYHQIVIQSEVTLYWIALFYEQLYIPMGMDPDPLLVDIKAKHSSAYIRTDLLYKNDAFYPNTPERGQKTALIVNRHRAFGVKPGTIVSVEAKDKYASLCSKKDSLGGITQPAWVNIAGMNGSRGGGSVGYFYVDRPNGGYAISTRNVYSPRLDTAGVVDLKYFDEKCSEICKGCFAANGEIFDEIEDKLPNGQYWVPVRATTEMLTATSTDNCHSGFEPSRRKKFEALFEGQIYIPDEKFWFKDYPVSSCSDQLRKPVEWKKKSIGKGYQDVPSFDRAQLICVQGNKPRIQHAGRCYKNSELDKATNKCKCKSGMEDVHDDPDVAGEAKKMGYVDRGEICLTPKVCGKKFNFDAVYFFIDGTGSMEGAWPGVQPFVREFKAKLDTQPPVIFWQWGADAKNSHIYRDGWDCIRYNKPCPIRDREGEARVVLEAGWTEAMYEKGVFDVFGNFADQWTRPWTYLNRLADHWQKRMAAHGSKNALLIFVTDGEMHDSDLENEHTAASGKPVNVTTADRFKKLNIYTHLVFLANSPSRDQIQDYIDSGLVKPEDYHRVGHNTDSLSSQIAQSIWRTICKDRTVQDIKDAI